MPLQAILEEFRDEPAKVQLILDSQKKAIAEMDEALRREFEAQYRPRIDSIEQEVGNLRAHSAALEAELATARKKCEEVIARLEAREAENLRLTENLVKTEADKDLAQAQRLQAFYADLNSKAAALEKSWDERHNELEAEYARKTTELREKHQELLESLKTRAAVAKQELDARDKQCSELEEALRDKEEALSAHAAELESSYQQKRHELDQLKSKLQKEIAAVVKDYQLKTAGGGKPATEDDQPAAGDVQPEPAEDDKLE